MRLNQQRHTDAEDIIQIQDINVVHLNITMTYKQSAAEGLDSILQLRTSLMEVLNLLPCCLTTAADRDVFLTCEPARNAN